MIICIKEPGKQIQYRVVTEISLELLQSLVGNCVKILEPLVFTKHKIGAIVAKEGLLQRLPFNFSTYLYGDSKPIVGTVVFVRYNGENFAGLTADQIKYLNICFEKGEVK